jgi:hypothetical protein
MRNIDASSYLKNPELEVVETKKDSTGGANFVLFASQAGAVQEEPAQPKGRANSRRGNTTASARN